MKNDLIKRQAAIDAIGEKPCGDSDWDLGCRNQWEWDTEILRTLPSAEPEPKKGEWVEDGHERGYSECSKCGYIAVSLLSERLYNFCPNCGADMRGE